ncbi:MAG: hypothetical protein ACTSVI_08820 [Promethearchaeota archaeon]
MVKIAFLVPVKAFSFAKSRLISALPIKNKEEIQLKIGKALYEDLVEEIEKASIQLEKHEISIVCCSPDLNAKEILEKTSIKTVFIDEHEINVGNENEIKQSRLDDIIKAMNDKAIEKLHVDGTVLLMSDLPLVDAEDIIKLVNFIENFTNDKKKIVLGPATGNGCNLIVRFPPNIIPTLYGNKRAPSFINHLDFARKVVKESGQDQDSLMSVYLELSTYLDLDTVEDLVNIYTILKVKKKSSRLLNVLREINLKIITQDDDNRKMIVKTKS